MIVLTVPDFRGGPPHTIPLPEIVYTQTVVERGHGVGTRIWLEGDRYVDTSLSVRQVDRLRVDVPPYGE